MRYLTGVLALLMVTCFGIGCVKQAESSNNSGNADVPDRQQDWSPWLQDRPLTTAMRRMWVDCNVIAGSTEDVAVRRAAASLALQAGRFESHLLALESSARETSEAVPLDWNKASLALQRTQDSCEACHSEFWPLPAHGIGVENLEQWKGGGQSTLRGTPEFHGPVAVRAGMMRLLDAMMQAEASLKDQNEQRLREQLARVQQFTRKNLGYWSAIRHEAMAIERAVRYGAGDGLAVHYLEIRRLCLDCHTNTAEDRGLTPLPWIKDTE